MEDEDYEIQGHWDEEQLEVAGFTIYEPSDDDIAESRRARIVELEEWRDTVGLSDAEVDELFELHAEELGI